MKTKYSFKWHFLRWAEGFANCIDGFCVVITFGFYSPDLSLRAMHAFLTETAKCIDKS